MVAVGIDQPHIAQPRGVSRDLELVGAKAPHGWNDRRHRLSGSIELDGECVLRQGRVVQGNFTVERSPDAHRGFPDGKLAACHWSRSDDDFCWHDFSRLIRTALLCFALLCRGGGALADTIVLKNGRRISALSAIEEGDKVFLFGFSRGAFTIRVLAGLLCGVGLLDKDKAKMLPEVWSHYREIRILPDGVSEAEKQKAAEQDRIKKGIDGVVALRKDGKFGEAQRQAQELLKNNPDNVAVRVLNGISTSTDTASAEQTLRQEKDQRTVASIRDIERSSVPPVGDIEFPKDWKEKTERRLKDEVQSVEANGERHLDAARDLWLDAVESDPLAARRTEVCGLREARMAGEICHKSSLSLQFGAGVWSGSSEGEHSLDVPGHGDEAPLCFDLCEAAQGELAEAHDRLDDAEHRLGRLLAQGVEPLALRRGEAMSHGGERRRVVGRHRRGGETLAPGWMMALARHGDQRGTSGQVSAHADFVYGFRQDNRIQNFRQLKKRAATIGCGAISDLPDHDVVIKAVPFRQARR